MNIPHASRQLPSDTRTRLQYLLNEGDNLFFDRNPGERERRRPYFLGEKLDGAGEPVRHVIVTRDGDGRLCRRFAAADEAVAS